MKSLYQPLQAFNEGHVITWRLTRNILRNESGKALALVLLFATQYIFREISPRTEQLFTLNLDVAKHQKNLNLWMLKITSPNLLTASSLLSFQLKQKTTNFWFLADIADIQPLHS